MTANGQRKNLRQLKHRAATCPVAPNQAKHARDEAAAMRVADDRLG